MKKNNKNYQNKKRFNVIAIAAVILASCGFVNYALGIGNPAAIYCDELGYQYVIKEMKDGQQGFCQFPGGLAVDGWKFFVGEEGEEYSYCKKQGYKIKTITSEQCQYASKCAVCILKDGTEMSIVKLMELDLKSTLSPWDSESKINNETEKKPVIPETNYLFYFVGAIVLIMFLVAALFVYKKIKNRNDYY